jgi:ArsR family transcriptional regulator
MAMPSRTPVLDDTQFALISKALADSKRIELLQKLGESAEAPTCSCVRDWLGLAPATVSHHLKELEAAGLVRVERRGKFAYLSLRRDVLNAYVNRLSSF